MNSRLRKIAIYLPQFHPIPENDEWWGKGFTEWTNVVKARSRFKGHYQPHLPADLGYYDLRLEESRMAQEALAKEYNIHGFCYYHYWFNGKRLLYEPLDRKLKNPKENLPFMMCWANESWTRAWDGTEKSVLLKQNYSEEDDKEHIKYLLTYFKDERYIKVNGKPFFIFYKPNLFPNMKRTIEIFRQEAAKEGIELYLGWFERWIGWTQEEAKGMGFDASAEFQPLSESFKKYHNKKQGKQKKLSVSYLRIKARSLRSHAKKLFNKNYLSINVNKIDYRAFVEYDLKQRRSHHKVFPGISPGWDNSSRRVNQSTTIFVNSSPKWFKKWYEEKCEIFEPSSEEENFIFINAWNEWAEGNHLEPCQRWGKAYLEAIK